jgi:hypothetical protein
MFTAYVNPMALCTPLVAPKQAYGPGPFRVVQTPEFVFMINDFAHTYRIIPADGRPHAGHGSNGLHTSVDDGVRLVAEQRQAAGDLGERALGRHPGKPGGDAPI